GVIGASFTIETALKGLYEHTIGRITEWVSAGGQTQEDAYAQKVASEYGSFIHTIPWYEFPYTQRLGGLWQSTELWGAYPIRKWERKVVLSLEFAIKSAYAWLIKGGTQSAYAPESLEIHVRAERVTDAIVESHLLKQMNEEAEGQSIITIPRYEAFTRTVPELVREGVRLTEIAGNDEILLTIIVPTDWQRTLESGTVLFTQPILTEPQKQRVAVRVPVTELHTALAKLESVDATLEHIYDY
ncbi:MAG: dehydrogenase, partial [Acidobacteriota bacterium]